MAKRTTVPDAGIGVLDVLPSVQTQRTKEVIDLTGSDPDKTKSLADSKSNAARIRQMKQAEKQADRDMIDFDGLPVEIQNMLAENPYLDISRVRLNPADVRKMKQQMQSTRGSAMLASPQLCKADDCPNSGTCPLLTIGMAPIGELCPIEKKMIEERLLEYRMAIYDNRRGMNSAPDHDLIEESTIMEIVGCDLVISRCVGYIQKQGLMIDTPAFGTNDSDVIYAQAEHPIIRTKRVTEKRKDDLLKSMLLTEEMQAKYKRHSAASEGDKAEEIQAYVKLYLSDPRTKRDKNGKIVDATRHR